VFAIDKKERMMVLAASSAIVAGVLGWLYLHHLENTFQEGSESASVLIANRYIVPGTPLTSDLFASAFVPKAYIQPTAIMDFTVLESSPGHPEFRNNIPLLEGSQLLQTTIAPLYSEDGLSRIIPDGHVAVPFGVDNIRGLSGNVRPGDLINILHTPKGPSTAPANSQITSMLFQAVPILAVGKKLSIRAPSLPSENDKSMKDASGEATEEVTVITVSLNPLAAVRLIQARETETLSIVLRPQGDDHVVEGLP
jgi:Flp pilus assembly protein CpaB